jgi:hypothetical protein
VQDGFTFFVLIDGGVMGLYWRAERENIRGYLRRKIFSALFSIIKTLFHIYNFLYF